MPATRFLRISSRSARLAGCLGVVLFAALQTPTAQQAQNVNYSFTRIADTARLAGVAGATCIGINSHGAVVFASNDGAIWLGDGGALSVAAQPDATSAPLTTPCPGVNDAGEVAYVVSSSTPSYTAVALKSGAATPDLASSVAWPFLTVPGAVSVQSLSSTGSTVVTGRDGMLYIMPAGSAGYSVGASSPALSSVQAGTMNDNHVVAFRAIRQVSGVSKAGIYRGSDTPLVEDGHPSVPFVGPALPEVNNAGEVVFQAVWPDGTSRVMSTANGVSFTDHSGVLPSGETVRFSINDAGVVVFQRSSGGAATGVFAGPNRDTDKVIAPGDALDGSSVVRASLSSESINTDGQIAFWALLADGRSGVYRATPAPATAPGQSAAITSLAANAASNTAPVAQGNPGGAAAAVRFDAPGDFLSRTANLPPIGSFTMMGWFRIVADTTTYSSFMALGTGTNGTNTYRVMRCCGNGWQEMEVLTDVGSASGGPLSPTGAWQHLAITVEGTGTGQLKTYVNGVPKGTGSGSPTIPAERLFIGNDGRGFWFDGSVAGVKIWNAPLSPAEIAQEMNQFTPVRTANLNAFYGLQSAAGATSDSSGNDNTLTIGGTLATDPNGPPLIVSMPLAATEDTPLSGTLQATDAEGDPLTFSIVSNGAKGTVVVTNPATGAFTYTPQPDANGADTFTFKANDGLADSNVATMNIAIAAVNDPPVAVNGTATVAAGASVDSTLVANDVDSSSRTFAIVANGTKGTATVTNAATGAYTYAANPGATGADSFTFRANDGSANSNVATVTVTISPSPAPVASAGSLSAVEDSPASGTLVASDPNGLALTYSLVANPTKGTAVITNTASGAYTYTPAANATGSDTFTFRVSNGTLTSNVATISVAISAVNDAPVAANGSASVNAGASVTGTLSASDIDSASLTFTLVANGSKGTATITNPATGAFTYAASAGSSGTDVFTFRASDGSLTSNVATVTVAIAPGVNHPPVALSGTAAPAASVRFDAAGDSLSRTSSLPPIASFTMMGWFRIIADTTSYSSFLALGHATGSNTYRMMRCCGNGWQEMTVLTGDGGADAGSLAPNGTWHHLAVTVSGTGSGQLKAYVDGALRGTGSGTPNNPAEKFFVGNDGRGIWFDGSAAAVKVYDVPLTQAEIQQEMQQFAPARTANLNGFYPLQSAASAGADFSGQARNLTPAGALATDPNGPPLSVIAPYMGSEDTPVTGTLQATDADGNALTYTIVANGTKGTAVVTNAATGAFTYTPSANASGLDTFTFKVNDGSVDSNVATVSVMIAPVNDAPVASAASTTVMSGLSVSGSLAATDVDSTALTFSLAGNGTKGTAVITNAATGAYTYTANGGTSGTDTFTFQANDGTANSNVATVTVSITPSPAPSAQNGSLSAIEDTSASGTLTATDPGGLPLTYSIVSNGSKGTATITNAATGQYTYAPSANANGSDSFTFRASNGTYLSNTATVSVAIGPVNDPPVAGNSTISVAAGGSVNGVLNVSDVDGDSLFFAILANGSKGTATLLNTSTGTFRYTANAGATGTDTFTFRVNDATANSNVGTVTVTIGSGTPANSAPVPLPAGGQATSVRFDAIGDELFRTTNLPSITSFTMMGWFRFMGDTNAYSAFLRLGHASSSHGYNLLRCCGGGWRELDLWNGAGIWTVKPSITLGTWYHFAVTVSGSGSGQVKTYVNGVLALTSAGNPAATADRLSIGNDAHEEWLNGNAAAVKIYSAPLTEAEIAAEMNRLTPVRTAGLNAWYPMQSGATAATDFSGNNRTLTQGGTLTTDSAGPPIQAGYTTQKNTPVSGVLQATDPDGDPVTFALGTPPAHGTVTVNANGNFTYTPTSGWTGTDSFTFTVSDGLASASATVSIIVVP